MLVAFKDFVKAAQRRASCLFLPAAWAARSLPQNLFGGANRYTPSPLSRRRCSCCVCLGGGCLVAHPAWSAPPSPCVRIAPLARGGCGCCFVCIGFARRRRPVHRRASRGRGVSSLGSLTLACRGCLGRGLCAPRLGLLAVAPCSPAWSWAQTALRSCAGYAPSRLGLSLSLRCALLGIGRKPPCAFVLRCCPARCRVQPLRGIAAPLQKLIKNQSKKHQKASKSALFVRHIAASVPVCVN